MAWFLYCLMLLHSKMCLFANRSSSSAHIMALPKLTFVILYSLFLSPLMRRWWFVVCVVALVQVNAVLAGALLTLFFNWNVSQSVWRVRSRLKSSDQMAHPLLHQLGACFKGWLFRNFCHGLIDCWDTFSIYNTL